MSTDIKDLPDTMSEVDKYGNTVVYEEEGGDCDIVHEDESITYEDNEEEGEVGDIVRVTLLPPTYYGDRAQYTDDNIDEQMRLCIPNGKTIICMRSLITANDINDKNRCGYIQDNLECLEELGGDDDNKEVHKIKIMFTKYVIDMEDIVYVLDWLNHFTNHAHILLPEPLTSNKIDEVFGDWEKDYLIGLDYIPGQWYEPKDHMLKTLYAPKIVLIAQFLQIQHLVNHISAVFACKAESKTIPEIRAIFGVVSDWTDEEEAKIIAEHCYDTPTK